MAMTALPRLWHRLLAHPWLLRPFTWLWAHRLRDDCTGKQSRVLRITGLRTALIETPTGQRETVTWL